MNKKGQGFLFRNRLMWHVLFWVFFYFFYVVSFGEYMNDYKTELKTNLFLLPMRMLGVYSLIYYLIPKLLLTKKYILFVAATALHALVYGLLIWFFIYNVEVNDTGRIILNKSIFNWGDTLTQIVDNYKIPAIAALIKIFKTWHLAQITQVQLKTEKQEAELSFLKTQIHPHFLFNTLNNLYSLTLSKSDKAPDVVLKLSDMLSYMLYDCNDEYVSLKKELDFIKNYISLQKIRHNAELVKITTDISGNGFNHKIAPLIILPIVENCFKHGIDKNSGNAFIKISIGSSKENLELVAENSLPEDELFDGYKDGLGLTNIKRRLELLYPENYDLEIDKEELIFRVSLKIRLAKEETKA